MPDRSTDSLSPAEELFADWLARHEEEGEAQDPESQRHRAWHMSKLVAGRAFLAVVALLATMSSCSIKVASNRLSSDTLDAVTTGTPYELELTIPPSETNRSTYSISYLEQAFAIEPDVDLLDIDVTWRFYPRRFARVHPFVGGGIGYYKFRSREVIDTCPAGFVCVPGDDEDFQDVNTKTIANGVNPHVVVGAYFPLVEDKFGILLEGRYEFLKEDNGFDLGSTSVAFGVHLGARLFQNLD